MSLKKFMLLFLTLCAVGLVQAKEVLYSLNYQNVALKVVLNAIEKQSNLVFVYNNEAIDNTTLVSITVKNQDINTVLSNLFSSSAIQFRMTDYYIFLTKAKSNIENGTKQKFEVTGQVLDENKNALEGVLIRSESKKIKALTDAAGNFKFDAESSDSSYIFNMLGYDTRKVSFYQNRQNVLLKLTNFVLNDLIVVGYGIISSKELTGAVSSMKSDALSRTINSDLLSSFQGQAAGVYATNDRLRVRGISSINSSSDPFVVIDGVPQAIALKDLNPEDVESVEILKDAASAAIYGSRAANGVILVTTRNSAYNTAPKFTLEAKTGIHFMTNQPQLLTGSKLLSVLDAAYYNKYPERALLPDNDPTKYFPFSSDYTGMYGYNRAWLNQFLKAQPQGEDWKMALTQPMTVNDYRLAYQGGQSQNKYYVSFSFRNMNEFINDKSNQRMTLLLKNEFRVKQGLSWGISSNSTLNFANNATFPSNTVPLTRSSLLPAYAPDNAEVLFDARNINEKKGANPLYQMRETWDDNVELSEVMTAFVEIKPIPALVFRSEWSVNGGTRRYRYFRSKDFYREDEAIDPTKSGIILYARTLSYGLNANNTINFNTQFNNNNKLKILLGNNIQSFNSDFNVARFEGFPTNYFELTNANTEKVSTRQSAGMDGYRFVSFFTRTQYAYKNKWFAEINARTDGTSRFVAKNKWGVFPGIGLSWVISDEDFIKKLKVLHYGLDYFKIRTNFGMVGNAEMGNFPAESRAVNWAEYAGSPGFVFDRIGNKEVAWEKQNQLNVGLNASLFKNKVNLNIDWYSKNNNDLLINYNIGTFQGYFSTDVTVNTGILNTKGLDVSLNSDILKGSFSWNVDLTVSGFSTNVIKLSTQQNYIEKGVNRIIEGQPMALYYLPIWAGIDPQTGHELIYEATGSENNRTLTGNILDAETLNLAAYNQNRLLVKDKSPYPDFFGGITNTFSYKNLELSFLIYFQYGNWLYHSGLRRGSYVSTYDLDTKFVALADHWSAENPNGKSPLLYNSTMANRESSRYLVDGSYLRLRNLSLRYALPKKFCKPIYAQGIKLFLQAQNLFTFSEFTNGDPEVSNGSAGAEANITPGNVGLNYGLMTFNVGINFEF